MVRSSVSRAVKLVDEVGAIAFGWMFELWRRMVDRGDVCGCGCRCFVDVGSRRRGREKGGGKA